MKANSTANITLGRFVQNHRERLGISLRELARRIKTSPALVSWIELDRGFPSKTVANNLAKALGVAAEEILKFDDRISAVRLRRTIERNHEFYHDRLPSLTQVLMEEA